MMLSEWKSIIVGEEFDAARRVLVVANSAVMRVVRVNQPEMGGLIHDAAMRLDALAACLAQRRARWTIRSQQQCKEFVFLALFQGGVQILTRDGTRHRQT